MASKQILAGIRAQLVGVPPFSQIQAEDLDRMVEALTVEYFAPGSIILQPDKQPPQACYIIKQGVVRVERLDMPGDSGATELAPGDIFPVGALLAERPVVSMFRSRGDTFLYRLPRRDFELLTTRSEIFFSFCKRRLGALLDLSQAQLHAMYAQRAVFASSLATPLHNLIRRAPVTCQASDTLSECLAVMHRQRVGSLLVIDNDAVEMGMPVAGILTRSDVIERVVLPGRPLGDEVRTVMTAPVVVLDARATAEDAALAMARTGVRHIPVVHDGRVKGMVSERDLFALQRHSVRALGEDIRYAGSRDVLIRLASDVRSFSHHLVAQGVGAAQVSALISSLNDRLTSRLVELIAARREIKINSICWIALGSEGRAEQTIATDQDNALIAADDCAHDIGSLVEFAQEVNDALANAGYPLCKGGVMAGNPEWCLPASRWAQKFEDWIESGDPESLRNAGIFFDLRHVCGDTSLCRQLSDFIAPRASGNVRFQKQLADASLRNRIPIYATAWRGEWLSDLLGNFEKSDSLDLKLQGLMPIVEAARVFALSCGITETGTRRRLRLCMEAGRLPAEEVAAWIDAFDFIQLMRLRIQHSEGREGAVMLEPGHLSLLDKRILKEALRQARKIQQRLELDFPG